MTDFSYLNFDVQIQRSSDGGYRLVVEAPSGETIRAPFEMPFSDLELENFMLKAGPTRRGVRRADTPEVDAAKRFGEKLYSALFTADVRSALQSSLDQARQRGEGGTGRGGVRLRLRLVDVPELSSVPWEYIYNPALNRFLALSTETPLVRYLDMPERIRPLQVVSPLRVLVMLPAPSDYPALDVEQEWLNLKTTVADLQQAGLVELELLETSTLTGLQRQLRWNDYHIFHFIGHGAFDRNAADGLLILEDEDGRGRPVSGQDLALLLHDHASLRLAVLNACEGALSAVDDPFAGVAQSLVQGGLPAVIAMQFEITDRAAIVFAHEFYRAMSDGYPVDAALTEARKVMLTESRGSGLEWGTPVLYMRSPDGRIFNLERRPQPTAAVTSTSPFAETETPRKQEPVEAAPSANRARGEVRSAGVLPDSTTFPSKAETPRARGTETPTARRNKLVIPIALALAVIVIAVAALLILVRAGSNTPTTPGQVPPEAATHNQQGVAAWEASELDKAVAELSEAIRLKPDYAEAYMNRAKVYRSQEKYPQAIADFTRAIELVPNDGNGYLERGLTYWYSNNDDNALSDFARASEMLPSVPDPYFYRGNIYLENGQFDKAIEQLDKALNIDPSVRDAYDKRAQAYVGKGDYDSAIGDYTRAIDLAPDDAAYFYYGRGEVYRLKGDKVKAIADYREALKQAQDEYLRTTVTDRLKVLESR
ncbi:MAG: tetratricopeptide repeat protein [Chloroflexota bacterium]|nr:tetratricopeptide repeat protein [Chloroflexota bacterium]